MNKILPLTAFAIGFVALGFALGQFVEARSPAPVVARYQPQGSAPAYTGRATFAFDGVLPDPLVLAPPDSKSLLDVLAEKDPYRRAARLAALLPTLGPEALPEIRTVLEKAAEMNAADLWLLTRFWATHEPSDAATWASYRSPTAYRAATVVAAIESWAAFDAPAAAQTVQLIAKLPGQDLSEAERALVRIWFDTGQPGIEDYIRDLGLTLNRQRALRSFFLSAVRRDGPEAAGRWAEAIPDDEKKFKIDAFRQLGAVLAQLDPADGVAWCEAHCDGRFGLQLRMLVAQQWALQDGPAAMEWVKTAQPGQQKDVAVMGAFRGWAQSDLPGLRDWLDGMGVDGIEPWFQPALPAVAATLLPSQPAEAMQWAEAIEEPKTRESSLVGLAREWRKKDPSAAEAWIASASLSAEARAQAMAPIRGDERKRATASQASEPEPQASEPEPPASG